MSDRLTEHFTRAELSCRCCGAMLYSSEAIARLEELRVALGYPMPITSGYRCPSHNSEVSSTGKTGPHTIWEANSIAVDINIHDQHAVHLLDDARARGWTGIGIQQKGHRSTRFVHLDRLVDAPGHHRPTLWSY